MNKKTIRVVLISSLLSAGAYASDEATSAANATLANVDGTVLVNQGERFITVQHDTVVSAGDRVLLMSGAHAQLVYADGCERVLEADSIATVGSSSPCAGSELEVNRVGPMTAQAAGGTAAGVGNATALAVFGAGAVAISYLIVDGDLSITESTVPPPVSP